MIFVDSNIPMYLVGKPHPHKDDTRRLLEQCINQNERLVTDAEVLQEILHRYTAINRKDAIQPAFNAVLEIVDEIFAVQMEDVTHARDRLITTEQLSARDALHIAVMERYGVSRILSFDTGFDTVPGIQRIA